VCQGDAGEGGDEIGPLHFAFLCGELEAYFEWTRDNAEDAGIPCNDTQFKVQRSVYDASEILAGAVAEMGGQ